ncbi:MAG: methionyl-tRNA formyltransferase [Ruminococcaceae bacterium]|nr:methionyl-tRNA formyltransferase [Oscillospiraceae bacterium]
MRILFMGTPEFAMCSLKAIYESGEEIVGVVTTQDKPKGRGMVLTPSDVKKYALEVGLPVYQPQTLKDGAFLDTLKELDPELIIVVAYGKILPKYVLDYPRYACINAHASILPKYRGAAPIQRSIIDGDRETGVSIMKMDVGLDTGDVMLTEKVTIEENDNFESVHDKLVVAGSQGLLKAIELFKSGKATFTPQGEEFTYAEKITKADCLIDFSKSAWEVHNQIRGLSPIPLAYTKTPDGKILKVTRAHIAEKSANADTGTVVFLDNCICVKCGDGVIALDEVIPEGKGRMSAQSYINGRKISAGDILG